MVGADNADELAREAWCAGNRIVNALRKAARVKGVLSTGNDAFVWLTFSMKAFEIGMVMSKHGTLVGNRIREQLRIGYALARPPCILDRPHVVAQTTQLFDNRQRKILIRIKPGHE